LDKRYELKQFHFHSPSEHTVNGQHYPMEVHLVHQNEAGELLVVGLLFEEGGHNDKMDQLPSFRAARGDDSQSTPFDYNDLVLEREKYFLYNGSLTTPPCTEGVSWVVMQQPITASTEQLQHYHDLLGFDNNRTLQPRNARVVLE
jgi:carbonic anhydrase